MGKRATNSGPSVGSGPDGATRGKRVVLRVADAEESGIKAMADKLGLSVSNYIRGLHELAERSYRTQTTGKGRWIPAVTWRPGREAGT